MRLSELASLRVGDVRPDGTLHVMGKGAKERIVPIGSTARRGLVRYLATRGVVRPADPLFTSRRRTALTARCVQQAIARLGRRAGVGTRCSPHTFRHILARGYLVNGGDVFSLQQILGHATLDMVRRYVTLSEADLVDRHRAASPTDRLAGAGRWRALVHHYCRLIATPVRPNWIDVDDSQTLGLDWVAFLYYAQARMVEEIDSYISAGEAARLLAVTPRRIYALVAADRLRAERVGGRLLLRREDVEARARAGENGTAKGHPFSPRRAWALLLLAAGQPVPGIDAVTRSKLRRLLAERSLWSLRAKLAPRAQRRNLRAHSSDLVRIESEPGLIQTGPRAASAAGLSLIGGEAPLQFYVDTNVALDLAGRYRMRESRQPNVVLRVVPDEPFSWLRGPIAPAPAVALDLAEDADPRSQLVAREVLDSR